METKKLRGVCLFGAFDPRYPRNSVIRLGLERIGVPVFTCRTGTKRKVSTRYPVLLARYLRMEKHFDVVLVPEFRHKDVPLAAWLSRATGKLCVFDPLVSRYDTKIHDRGDAADKTFQAWHNRNIDRWSMSLADLVLADTSAHAEYYARELAPPDASIRVLPVGYDDVAFVGTGPEPVDRGGPVRVVFFGNYLPLHGVETIVRAAAIMKGDAGVEFELIGGGQTYPGVERFVRAEGLDNVTLTPRVPTDELPARVARASVCLGVFGGTDKALRVVPNKVFQCMGMDRPVVTARSPAVLEHFRDGVEVALVPPADPVALAAAIRRLVSDAGARRAMGAAAGRVVRERFSAPRIAESFAAHCAEAMGAKG
jgi:glycosyltransferase involved in cell wall biosynthesis